MAGHRVYRGRQWKRLAAYVPRRRTVPAIATSAALISGTSSAVASASLTLTTTAEIAFTQSAATASGTLTLATTSAVDPRAAPGWLGLFITDTATSSVPTISGGSTATASGSLNLQTPTRAQIGGSSSATASGSLLLRSGASETRIATPTSLGSSQFSNSTISSAQFGNSIVTPYTDHPIS